MLPPDTVYGRRIYKGPNNFESMISIVVMGTDRAGIKDAARPGVT